MLKQKGSSFKGKYYYYENVNWKEKKVEKEFSDKKKFDAFVKTQKPLKIQMPTFGILDNFKTSLGTLIDKELWLFFGPSKVAKKALPAKKPAKKLPKKLKK